MNTLVRQQKADFRSFREQLELRAYKDCKSNIIAIAPPTKIAAPAPPSTAVWRNY
jgi:hypothetical protein